MEGIDDIEEVREIAEHATEAATEPPVPDLNYGAVEFADEFDEQDAAEEFDAEGDSKLMVQFVVREDGREYLKIAIPGDITFHPEFRVTELYKRRFPLQYEAFRRHQDQFAGQIRLEDVPWMDEVTRNHLRARNVYTLENLAAVSDAALGRLGMKSSILRDKALQMVREKKKAADYGALEGKLDETMATNKGLVEAMERMEAELKELRANQRQQVGEGGGTEAGAAPGG